jgi:hypothetical protein
MTKNKILKHLHTLTPDWFDDSACFLTPKSDGGCTVTTIKQFPSVGTGKREMDRLQGVRKHVFYPKNVG